MNIRRQHWLLNRRHLLRGVGVALALPLLDCMRPLGAAGERTDRPRRSVFIYLPNGVNTLDWQITQAGADYQLSKSLLPLARHRANLTPFSGLHNPNAISHHHNGYTVWLSGAKIGPAVRNTISVDQLMAQVTAPHTRFPSLEMTAPDGGCLAVSSDGVRLPALIKPSAVFSELFEEPKGGIAVQRRGLHRRGSIIDAVLAEARALGSDLGQADRGRLDQYLTSVREVEVRTGRSDRWLDTARPQIEADTRTKLNRDVPPAKFGDYLRTMFDLIVLAFQTDLTRVATFSTGLEGQGPAIPELGITQSRHALSHHGGNPDLLRQFTEADTFLSTQFAYFLDRLSAVQDADGPLLDTTMALYGSAMSYGHSHGMTNLPIILAGGAKLGLKHGKHVDFNVGHVAGYELANPGKHYAICHRPVNPKAHLSNLLLTMAQRMGVETTSFADSLGTVSEVLA